ncbi:JAB domain-containing protein [[Clostridium] colinum]|uniref:JAB domain-containing protein n=1 Tax=[Clostridium] colinum TaxID=36835 RepID=UPI002024DB12|nr:JAB domain-containing protein [[Clostridium] colinum]
MTKNLHANHRKRVRARFIKDGNLDSFEQHQVLELLLFYSVPRRDTNELAHKLLNEYGSLYTLMNAKPEDIIKRCKVSETTAVLISMIPYVCRKFLSSALDNERPCINSFNIAHSYFESILIGKPFESFYMLCLDLNKRLKKIVKISEGVTTNSPIYMEKVVGDALLHNSSFVIIGHNHPNGNKKPSSADVEVTMKITNALLHIDIKVLDHIIICGDDSFSFAKKGLCNLRYQ